MYSKKVIQHFQNPRNMGKMKNPDAMGEVGNPTCLLPDEKIFLDPEFTVIKNTGKKNLIFSHDASKNKIINKSSRDYNGKIIEIKNALGKISLTPEHLIYALKLPNHSKYFRTKHKQKLIPAWYHAKHLEQRDIVLYPILKKIKDIKYIKIDIPKKKFDFKSIDIPKKIQLNSELLRLFGYFLSEGNIQDKPCKTYISFSLNIKEKDIVKDIKKISKKLFGLDVKIKEVPKNKVVIVFLYNARLARFFKQLFGNGAEYKKIPNFIMTLPLDKQKSLIEGLWKGDGCINLNRIGPRAGYVTISYHLAQQIKLLLIRQKIVLSMYEEKEKKVNGVNHKKAYRIHVGHRDSLKILCKILGIKYSSKGSYKSITSWFDNDFLYTPITKIERKDYKGKVYNLEVEDKHSFLSEAFALHNCGDIMRLYLKIKDDKIIDISFETMGCVAAISTSSMITEMAKGKTLAQALKISYNDVANELGKLPPVKVHCADLAVKALQKAIKNYGSSKTKTH